MSVFPINSTLDLSTLFPFELDNFQVRAIAALEQDKSVVVSVPTGSGKTLVGEYAIHRALAKGKRVFYTTPLKALSNQKLRDFQEQFGSEQVGLLTGDISVNRNAGVVVMTTEIFRNMLYGTSIGAVGTSLENVETVVLDECHYMNDPNRGTVWEESIIYCPQEIQLVALSATIANAGQLTDWINEIHGATELIKSDFRPVPLEFYFSNPKGLFPLLDQKKQKINSRLKPKKKGGKNRVSKSDCPDIGTVVEQLAERDLLPAIYFIFSRRGCDLAVEQLNFLSLVTAEESEQIQSALEEFLHKHPEGARAAQVEPLRRGIAAHHAGILPAWKGLVEELFTRGLVKVVFATETLAAGINMPARTTVISSLSKRTDQGHRLLRASEFLQMSGRAGRRGMDERGNVVCVQTRFEGAKEAAYLATQEADPLVSQFTPTYGMVLNLLQRQTIQEAKSLLQRSFAQYLANQKLIPEQKAIAQLTQDIARIDVEIAPIPREYFHQYEKLQAHLKEERRILKYLERQAQRDRAPALNAALAEIRSGDLLYLKGKYVTVATPMPAVLVDRQPSPGQSSLLICLAEDNRWYVATERDVSAIGETLVSQAKISDLQPPRDLELKPGKRRRGNEITGEIAEKLKARTPPNLDSPEVEAQQAKIANLQQQLKDHPLQQWGQPKQLLKTYNRRRQCVEELQKHQANTRENQSQHWQEFLNICEVLKTFQGLDNYHQPTPLGETAATIRGDNELWLALVLRSGYLDQLSPSHLAAAACALITETPRPDSETDFPPPLEVMNALNELRSLRRELFQVQRRYRVAIPLWLEPDLIGLVEQWVEGKEWYELCQGTNLDEGDLVRILRRTRDFLSQIPHVPYLTNSLKDSARTATQAMERFPVQEFS
ncbi:DEAD/DEAH box helicase [Euhalothece natronophila Z-M001]|uniref:DEAD/DEAH box helicase n=1 Tax=Euhalothece natronophila Z-M001 TaxID=522448 RepID=A0A5B8NHR2_9CHRO|nr:DEAD/DEAH box helicase [Euhalothece natronophila]QDZ38478.1 DEAD/DEAH box helicase [Euhalothece natronophila Z-M001]